MKYVWIKKPKNIEYEKEVFLRAQKAFTVYNISASKILEKLEDDDQLSRWNRITIGLSWIDEYDKNILMLKIERTGSKIGTDNYYSWPLPLDKLQLGLKYEITFFEF